MVSGQIIEAALFICKEMWYNICVYENCGFTRSHVLKNFFKDHYDHPIYAAGRVLWYMIYLQRHI